MKLKINYENVVEELEVNSDEMWSCLGLGDATNLSKEEKEKMIQNKVNNEWNKPDYNNWHNFQIHKGYTKMTKEQAEKNMEQMDLLPDYTMEEILNKRFSYDETCKKIRKILGKHKVWADILIAVVLDGDSVAEYAREIGKSRTNVAHMYERGMKILKKFYKNSHKMASPNAYI